MPEQDEKILQCARDLIKAINESGRMVLMPDVGEDFGALHIWVQDNCVEIEHGRGTNYSYGIVGPITDVR